MTRWGPAHHGFHPCTSLFLFPVRGAAHHSPSWLQHRPSWPNSDPRAQGGKPDLVAVWLSCCKARERPQAGLPFSSHFGYQNHLLASVTTCKNQLLLPHLWHMPQPAGRQRECPDLSQGPTMVALRVTDHPVSQSTSSATGTREAWQCLSHLPYREKPHPSPHFLMQRFSFSPWLS